MNLVLQLISGVMISGLSEGMALADRIGLEMKDVMDVMGLTNMACPFLLEKAACKFKYFFYFLNILFDFISMI